MDLLRAKKLKKIIIPIVFLLLMVLGILIFSLYSRTKEEPLKEDNIETEKEFVGDRPEFEEIYEEWKKTDFSNWNVIEDKELGIRVKVPPEYRRTDLRVFDVIERAVIPEKERKETIFLNNKTDEDIIKEQKNIKEYQRTHYQTEYPSTFGEKEMHIRKLQKSEINEESFRDYVPCIDNENYLIESEWFSTTGGFNYKDKKVCYSFSYQYAGIQQLFIIDHDKVIEIYGNYNAQNQSDDNERINHLKILMFISFSYENI